MGNKNSRTTISTSDFLDAVRQLGQLSENDMKLVDYAKFKIPQSMMDKTQLVIDFKDREALSCLPEGCSKSEIKSQMIIAYDEDNKPQIKIQHVDFLRRFSPMAVNTVNSKTTILASDFLIAVSQLGKLSEKDEKLRDFAKFQIQEHMLDKTELFVHFKDREALSCLPEGCSKPEIKSQMLIAYDEDNKPKMKMKHIDLTRRIPSMVVTTVKFAFSLLPLAFNAILAGRKMITN